MESWSSGYGPMPSITPILHHSSGFDVAYQRTVTFHALLVQAPNCLRNAASSASANASRVATAGSTAPCFAWYSATL